MSIEQTWGRCNCQYQMYIDRYIREMIHMEQRRAESDQKLNHVDMHICKWPGAMAICTSVDCWNAVEWRDSMELKAADRWRCPILRI